MVIFSHCHTPRPTPVLCLSQCNPTPTPSTEREKDSNLSGFFQTNFLFLPLLFVMNRHRNKTKETSGGQGCKFIKIRSEMEARKDESILHPPLLHPDALLMVSFSPLYTGRDTHTHEDIDMCESCKAPLIVVNIAIEQWPLMSQCNQ